MTLWLPGDDIGLCESLISDVVSKLNSYANKTDERIII